ncbi:MAG: hypothetical protein ACYDH6_22165 [Acidimicrobiales bacterium]
MTRRLMVVLAAGAVAFAAAVGAVSVAAADGRPTVLADRPGGLVGSVVHVHGTGFDPTDGTVQIAFCGNLALNGSGDCDLANTNEPAIGSDGTWWDGIRISAPPVACPCVIRVGTHSNPTVATVPISIAGLAVVPPHKDPAVRRVVTVTGVHLEGGGPLLAWFGAAPGRTLVYNVTNGSDIVLHDPPVDISFGRGRSPTGFVEPPHVGDLAVGQTKTFRVHLPFGALAWGTFTAKVQVDPVGDIGSAAKSTVVIPWGLIAAGVVALQGLVVLLRNRLRSWLRRRAQRAAVVTPANAPRPIVTPDTSGRAWSGPWLPRTIAWPPDPQPVGPWVLRVEVAEPVAAGNVTDTP